MAGKAKEFSLGGHQCLHERQEPEKKTRVADCFFKEPAHGCRVCCQPVPGIYRQGIGCYKYELAGVLRVCLQGSQRKAAADAEAKYGEGADVVPLKEDGQRLLPLLQ